MKEAILYKKLDGNLVRCELCSHSCVIKPDEYGICEVRHNKDGILYTDTYNKIIATHVDPIEKKPLFHYKPGSKSFSIATVGCNFKCTFCQNHDISQWPRDRGSKLPGDSLSPAEIAKQAALTNSATIAYTYTEPTIFAELALETAYAAKEHQIDSIFVTNGFMSEALLDKFGNLLKAANVDLKAYSNQTYKEIIGGRLEPVLETIKNMHARGIWLEITTLVIPDMNDSDTELTSIAEFIAGVDPAIPWHISAFHPQYKMTTGQRTPVEILMRAYKIGKRAGLRFVYPGNCFGNEYESTFCPKCGSKVIVRQGFSISEIAIKNGLCVNCFEQIEGVY